MTIAQVRRPRRRVDGVLLLDKPAGMTSNAALQVAKRLFEAEKAGHTGTLDPFATGLLPLCFGDATKFAQMLHVVISGIVVEDAVVGGFTLIAANGLALEFGLELGQVSNVLLRRSRCRGGRRRSRTADLVQDSVLGFGVVDQRVLLGTMEELESARIFLVTVRKSASSPGLFRMVFTLTSTGGAAFWRLMLGRSLAFKKREKVG